MNKFFTNSQLSVERYINYFGILNWTIKIFGVKKCKKFNDKALFSAPYYESYKFILVCCKQSDLFDKISVEQW